MTDGTAGTHGADGTSLADALAELEQVLTEHAAPVVPLLAPGLGPDRVVDVLRGAGLPPHPDLLAWWAWHDGVRAEQWRAQVSLVGALWPLPLRLAAARWRSSAEDPLREEGIDPPVHVFPVVGVENRAVVGVDTRDGSVVVCDPHDMTDPPYVPSWPSLAAMVGDVVATWRSGTLRISPDEGPVADRARWPQGVPRSVPW